MKVTSVIIASALAVHQVSAHGYLSQPKAEFLPDWMYTDMVGEINANTDPDAFGGLQWNRSPDQNAEVFTQAFPNSKYSNLKEMIDANYQGCGPSNPDNSPVDVSGISSMTWQNNEYQEGFLESHTGPCEAWIDDQMVAQDMNCARTYTGYPAEIPIDYSACSGTCEFKFYWLALHSPEWQMYKNCVKIQNGAGGGNTMADDANAAGNGQAPAGNGQAPAGNGQAPAGNGQAPTGDGQAPAGDGQAPAGNGQAPAGDGQAPAGNGGAATGNEAAGADNGGEAPSNGENGFSAGANGWGNGLGDLFNNMGNGGFGGANGWGNFQPNGGRRLRN